MLPFTSFIAALLALMLIWLAVHVIRGRLKYKTGLGDGGEEELLRRRSAQANFCEYVPLALILMALAELQAAALYYLLMMGLLLFLGRVSHAASLLSREPAGKGIKARQAGMVMTFLSLLMGAGYAFYVAIMSAAG